MPVPASADRSRGLGQHFLGNGQLAARLVADAGVGRGDRVVDLGAGTGLLTAALAARAATVLAVEIDPRLAAELAAKFERVTNVTIVVGDATALLLPRNPYRVVANPPFGHTAAILHRLLDDPAGGLVRADVVVQWQVARHRAKVSDGEAADLTGASWAPWWRFTRGRRLPAAWFRPRPSVDAAILTITRKAPPLLPAGEFEPYNAFVQRNWAARMPDSPELDWLRQYAMDRGKGSTSRRRP